MNLCILKYIYLEIIDKFNQLLKRRRGVEINLLNVFFLYSSSICFHVIFSSSSFVSLNKLKMFKKKLMCVLVNENPII